MSGRPRPGPGAPAREDVIGLVSSLVAIDSVNPSLVAGGAGEGAIAAFIAGWARDAGLEVEILEETPGRPSVLVRARGTGGGRTLMLCGHVDTVGVEGMAAPFMPAQRDGRLYGRGAQDMKGGVAAMIDAARVLATGGLAAGRLIVAAVVDEEYASLGADALVTEWQADAAVVTEPTDLEIAIAHKGFAWFEVETRGRAAHGSRPADGRDAILRMGRVLQRLEGLDRALQSRAPHALVGLPSLHASIVNGGRELSSYPDRCVLQFERRTIPGESDEVVKDELSRILAALSEADAEFDAEGHLLFARPSYELAAGHPLVAAAVRAVTAATGRALDVCGMSFWTDAAVLGGSGIPSNLFGPGGAGLHSTEEYVRIADVLACRDVLVALARDWCQRTN